MEVSDLRKLKYISLIVLIIIFALISIYRIQSSFSEYKNAKTSEESTIYKQAEYVYGSKINIINTAFISRLNSIVSQSSVIRAIKSRDRDALYALSIKRFKTIKKDFPTLSIMHYHLPDYTSLLRVHKRDQFGDNLKEMRPMIAKVIDSKRKAIGFEEGLFFSDEVIYRVAIPIMDGDILIGVVELGINIYGILNKINSIFGASRDESIYMGFLLHNNNMDTNIRKKYKFITDSLQTKKIVNGIDYADDTQDIEIGDKTYFVFWNKQNIHNYRGEEIGTILYAFDITKIEKEFKESMIFAIAYPLMEALFFGLILNLLFGYIIRQNRVHDTKVKSIVDSQSAIVVVTDGVRIIQTNRSFFLFFGVTSLDEFLVKYSCICDRFEDSRGYLYKEMSGENWLTYMLNNTSHIHKAKMINHNGEEHIFHVNHREFDQYRSVEYVISFEDITALESEIERNQMQNQQLIHQSRLAQMGEMIAMIAHQWRQPLAAISATSGAITVKASRGTLDKDTAMLLSENISGYSQHMSETIDDFRDFFKSKKKREDTCYGDMIDDVLGIIGLSLTNKNIEVVRDNNSDVVFHTYQNEVKQVILNLIKNAEDILLDRATQNPKITIQANEHTLVIMDNAGGVPEDILDKIFDPYFSTKIQKDGTGLGLYMSKTIIEEHCSGELSIYNDSDGAVFTITL